MKKVAVELSNVEKKYDASVVAVKDVNLKFYEGEWTMIMGPSGSGKTTLLNMISCLDRPTSGKILVLGQDLTGMSNAELTEFRRNNLGQIFQQYHLMPYLNALENVMLAQYFHSVANKPSAIAALKDVGLDKRTDHIPSKLSGGEQQRVAIARALINEPSIILADEPTGNLDRKNGELIIEILEKLHSRGQTIIFVTHNQDLAERGDRIVELADGMVVTDRMKRTQES
ncbi:MAG TPA: ABC transporter ATP-binding protein [Methanocella sp.]|jgi:putative ABC transport system ATP-binding protein